MSMKEVSPGLWRLRVYNGTDSVTGRARYKERRFHGGVQAATVAHAELITEVAAGRHKATKGTVGYLLDEWMAVVVLSPTTRRTYEGYIRKWLREHLGDKRLDRLTTRDIDRLYATMRRDGKKTNTVRQVHAILHAALEQAADWGWITVNPATKAKPGKYEQHEIAPPSMDAMRGLIVSAAERFPKYVPIWWLGVTTGARRGELLGLRWKDIDLKRATMSVRQNVVQVGREWHVKDPKAHQARTVALDPVSVEVLRRHRAEVDKDAKLAEERVTPASYVFSPDPGGQSPFLPNRVSRAWRRLCDDAGMEVRLHDLRHLHISDWLEQGKPLPTLVARVGHNNAVMINRVYGHTMPGTDRVGADELAERFPFELPSPDAIPHGSPHPPI